MATSLVRTGQDWSATFLRLVLAVVIFPHGAQKLLGWFGGYGFQGTMAFFTETMGLPWAVGVLVIVTEFFAPVALAVGLLSRVAAIGVAGVMVGAIVTTHARFGFFMNWSGASPGEGFEYHLLVLGIAAVVALKGSGAASVDKMLGR